MGIKNSMKTRVKPIFDKLRLRDNTGVAWFSRLVALAAGTGHLPPLVPCAPLSCCGWGDEEIPLRPPRQLLLWLVRHAELCDEKAHRKTSRGTRAKRDLLLKHDMATVEEAIKLLEREPLSIRGWYVLEGPTRPDVYLENDRVIVVIEGKRTEPAATTCTTWMPIRHQMLRHLDCAWERRAGRNVFGFFIVEGECPASCLVLPPAWQHAVEATIKSDILKASLPHRNEAEREKIAGCFLGATTWQKVCREFNIPWSELPN